MTNQPKPEVKCEHKLNKNQMEQFGRDECAKCGEWIHIPASTEEWQDTADKMKEVICDHENRAYEGFRDDSGYWRHGEMRDVGVVADRILENILPILRSHDQQLRQRIVEWAADERDKADAHYAKEQDDYSQGYFMAMNTVMKHLETPPSSPTYK